VNAGKFPVPTTGKRSCAVVARSAADDTPTSESPIHAAACFATHGEADAWARAQRPSDRRFSAFTPATAEATTETVWLGADFTEEGRQGMRLDFYGSSGDCIYGVIRYKFSYLDSPWNDNFEAALIGASYSNCSRAAHYEHNDFQGYKQDCFAGTLNCYGAIPNVFDEVSSIWYAEY
jgi:hypothetical protein